MLGVLSLIFWALILVVTVKYLVFVLRADNSGEGGILALTALVTPLRVGTEKQKRVLVLLGLFGAALLYGDGMITPAISVLSAVEGIEVVAPRAEAFVIPATVLILVGLFTLQKRGTGGVGKVFGPVMAVWFVALAVLGGIQVWHNPSVLAAVSPLHALTFFSHNGVRAVLVLGACSWWSPAAKRCTRTWATSERSPSASCGSRWCCPASC